MAGFIMCPFSLVVEHQSCKLEVASSILAGGSFENRNVIMFSNFGFLSLVLLNSLYVYIYI